MAIKNRHEKWILKLQTADQTPTNTCEKSIKSKMKMLTVLTVNYISHFHTVSDLLHHVRNSVEIFSFL